MADALVIIKPDGAHRLAVRETLWEWLRAEHGWTLRSLAWFKPDTELIDTHYDFLRKRAFFPWLLDFMTALPILVGRVDADNTTLEHMRYELGETRINESRPGSLRERLGIGGGVNVLHLSDSAEAGVREAELWGNHVQLTSVDVEFGPPSGRPDHTFHLRSLASQYAGDIHRELAAQEIRKLLREESDLTGTDFDALTRIVLGAFTF